MSVDRSGCILPLAAGAILTIAALLPIALLLLTGTVS